MIGAVSTQRGLFHAHTFAESNTTETFVKFLTALRKKCEGRDCVVVMDNQKLVADGPKEQILAMLAGSSAISRDTSNDLGGH
jgi:hypothetical protein